MLPQFKAINTVLGNLKTALSGTHHALTSPNMPIAASR